MYTQGCFQRGVEEVTVVPRLRLDHRCSKISWSKSKEVTSGYALMITTVLHFYGGKVERGHSGRRLSITTGASFQGKAKMYSVAVENYRSVK
ncbi:hypothetical protein AVEN_232369-1 [Araneus ventricosus]|uniref:Uncharacterized protein n=1 Tax=Araneus ventricosus TaxID=182803 RepID=A0A4Y2WE64_ARAVE|nr:hypothetical protein AVEN_232369-1 [Araneus ventricosus]